MQVRAVLVFYGDKINTDNEKSLFNKRSWRKANNLLHEILDRNASGPPNVEMYVHRLNMKGEKQRDKYGFYLYY